MKILCVFGRYNYGDPGRGEGVEYTHLLPALRALGHEVRFFESFSRTGHADFAALNRALLEEAQVFRPQVVFTVLMMVEIWLETVALLRRAGCRVLNWSTDDSWKYAQFSRLIATDFDLWASTCPDAAAWYARDGIVNAVQTQWAASSAWLAPPLPAAQCTRQAVFVGSAYGTRPARIEALRTAGFDIECFGYGWPRGPLAAAEIPGIFRSARVSLNFSEPGQGATRQIKARIFEVPAAGGLLLTENAPHLEKYFEPGSEVACFDDDGQLARRLRELLAESVQRDKMAAGGHARVAAEHTYERRLENLLTQILPSGTPMPLDWVAFEDAAARHRVGWGLWMLRAMLVAPCMLVWGRTRGRRAARRALFEFSWRILGRHTYTAAGWPGRLFYAES